MELKHKLMQRNRTFSRLISNIFGFPIQFNKAITGQNALDIHLEFIKTHF